MTPLILLALFAWALPGVVFYILNERQLRPFDPRDYLFALLFGSIGGWLVGAICFIDWHFYRQQQKNDLWWEDYLAQRREQRKL